MRWLVIGLCCFSIPCLGQWTEGSGWLGVGVDQALPSGWSWSAQYENRWDAEITRHRIGIVDLAVERKLAADWDFNVQWRFAEVRNKFGGYVPKKRLALRLLGEWDAGQGEVKFRSMWAQGVNDLTVWSEGEILNQDRAMRLRVGYQHAWKGLWRWSCDAESFFEPKDLSWAFQQSRFRFQWSYRLSSPITLGAGYIWTQEWNQLDPWSSHTISIQANWSLAKRKARDRKPSAKPLIPGAQVYDSNGQPVKTLMDEKRVCSVDEIRISEVHAKGHPADYIELHHPGANTCVLTGWRLTEGLEELGFLFGPVVMPEQARWLGYRKGIGSFKFGISAQGETLFLVHPSGEWTWIQTLPQGDDTSQTIDSEGNIEQLSPSPGY
ncbi:MAG: DUF2490 domain-containing protein [Flavobacteriales bacterium]|nr:DUF2490 domain-containing protein [Flavobacteriales bacterium]